MRGCLAAAVLLVSAAAAPACRRTAAEMVAALDLRRLSHSPCASAVIHADERYVLKHVLTRRDSLLERETCVLQKLQRFDWAPRWFCTGDDYILTEWRGKEMCERTESYDAQVRRILDELHAAGVRHNDLRKRERTDFTVAAGRVSLVDFAYASVRGSLEMSCKGSFGLLKAGGNLTRSSSELEWGMAAPERGAAADLPQARCGASKQVARVRGLCRPACIHEPYAGFEHLPRCEPTPYVPPTAGDWQCYAARNPDVAAALGRKVGALARHFYRHGFAEGRSPYCEADKGRYTCAFPHCDEARAEVALVVMTKDDWPLASRWLAWHGHVYGFEHLYVFDGSTGAQKDHLQDVTASYPIHLRHSLVDLNHIEDNLARWIDEIKARYDWIIKVDTDEFVAHVAQGARAPDVTTSRLGLPPARVSDTLRTAWAFDVDAIQRGPPTDGEHAKMSRAGVHKQIYSGARYRRQFFNLGSHAWHNRSAPEAEGLAIVHYHQRTYEELIRLAHDVIVSHGYIEESDSRDVKIEKLARLDQRPTCQVNSCHKNWVVLDDLRNRTAMRRAYYARDRRNAPILRDFSRRLREIFAMYPALVVTNASEP